MCPTLFGPRQSLRIQTIGQCASTSRRNLRNKMTEKVCPDSAAACKNLHQFLGWYYFELRIGAVTRRFIFTPSSKLCRMSEAGALHMLVGDLYHQLGA